MVRSPIDLVGQRFGRLVATLRGVDERGRTVYRCVCDCGTVKAVQGSHLSKTGDIRSCGCLLRETTRKRRTSHGATAGGRFTPEYIAFHAAKQRCTYTKHDHWKDYGGRGIQFLFSSFEAFFAELGPKPTPKHSVDRIDVNGHYEKGNVKWSTQAEQIKNRRPRLSQAA